MMTKSDLHEDRPTTSRIAAISFVIGIVALMGAFSAIELVAYVIFVDGFVWDSAEGRRVMIALPMSLLIGAAALWGLMRLKPWGGPISPKTRKTNILFYLSGLLAVPGALALHFGAVSRDNPYRLFSNDAIPSGIAVFAVTSWLLAWVAARAGLLPEPDAMVLWCVTMGVIGIGWLWHRYR